MAESKVLLVLNRIADITIFSQGNEITHIPLICTTNHIDSELHDVVIKDSIDELKKIEGRLKVGDQLTPTNNTVLHLACQYGSINCVKQILNVHDSLLLKVNSRDETALHLAAREGHYDVVVTLINAAKSLQKGAAAVIEALINAVKDSEVDVPPVHQLIRKANLELETALHVAVRYNHKNVVELLVSEDPSHEHPPNAYKETPMYLATVRCHTDIMETILNKCAFPTFGGPEGRTALHAAVLDGDCNGHECLKLLLKKKQYLVTESDNYGWTVLHYVAFNDLYPVVEDIAGANLWEIVDVRGQNILHIAVERNKKGVIRFILSQGCKASNNLFIQRDVEGNTPLHFIAKLGCYVQELMDLKALDWEVLNYDNFTPLMCYLLSMRPVLKTIRKCFLKCFLVIYFLKTV
ncbi:hypothetical protein AgCh_026266 [Apium graveolens]